MCAQYFGDHRIEDLTGKLILQTTDFETGQGVVLTEGRLADAVYASMAILPFLPPLQMNGRCLFDGCFSSPLPIMPAVAFPADIHIVLEVLEELKSPDTVFMDFMLAADAKQVHGECLCHCDFDPVSRCKPDSKVAIGSSALPKEAPHWIAAQRTAVCLKGTDWGDAALECPNALQMGAVFPDLPYYLAGTSALARHATHLGNRYHGAHGEDAYDLLRALLASLREEDVPAHRAFWIGVVSHVCVDTCFHP